MSVKVPDTPALSHWCTAGGWGSYDSAGNCERCGDPRPKGKSVTTKSFQRIVETNQWESVTYTLGNNQIDRLKNGDVLWLLLPDRSQVKARVEMRPTVRSYSDHGQTTDVPGDQLYLHPLKPALWHGLSVHIDHLRVRARRA